MSVLAANPELQRNGRIQLRRGRVLAVAVICAAVSLSLVTAYNASNRPPRDQFVMVFILQALALVVGGSIYCLQSVQREKDQNTFDFQRVTRLSPLQLALGKVLGAPAVTYLAALCLMPVALWTAIPAGITAPTFFAMYLVLLLGTVTFHSFAVLISMVLEKGTSAGAMFLFLWAAGTTAIDVNSGYSQGPLAIHAIGPFWLYNLIGGEPYTYPPPPPAGTTLVTGPITDLFFGQVVPHAVVLLVLYLTMTAWFLLALVRNIKRDPAVYELFRPVQAFGLALYLNFLVLAFFRWRIGDYVTPAGGSDNGVWQFHQVPAQDALATFLVFNFAIFVALGLTLVRNRERTRRILREYGASFAGWLTALWPAHYLVGGVALCGVAILYGIRSQSLPPGSWSFGVGVLQITFVAAWLARDFIYLQWMSLRRARRPMLFAVLYLVVYYSCTGIVLAALNAFNRASSATAAIFTPSAVFYLDAATWSAQQSRWLASLALLLAQSLLFAWLQRRELKHLAAAKPSTAPVAP